MILLNKFRLKSKHRKILDPLSDDDKVRSIFDKFVFIEDINCAVVYYDLNNNDLLKKLALSKLDKLTAKFLIKTESKASIRASTASYFAQKVIKGRWIEAEDIIKQDPIAAVEYAYWIIKGRWAEAEDVIKQDPQAACNYCINIINGRWIEAEDFIKQDPQAASVYAVNIIKKRWKEAEDIIKTDANSTVFYAVYVIKDRWIEAEETIKNSACRTPLYAQYLNYLNLVKEGLK